MLQIAEALDFLSPQVHHHNVCPSSILVTKTGTWKLSGLEFIGKNLAIWLFGLEYLLKYNKYPHNIILTY